MFGFNKDTKHMLCVCVRACMGSTWGCVKLTPSAGNVATFAAELLAFRMALTDKTHEGEVTCASKVEVLDLSLGKSSVTSFTSAHTVYA